ncbi:hypothetical protein NDU88_002765 [Pleurodeles waltl]|uniref:Peptidase A2 domain-containing protein n=1 Tax=Pleurodeles waltl TaxID=8319 RepID=A0AAV7TMN9_PLEWA|nr:hypothetical protein NDU88_002765 [Pleurodeles waltl]
MVYTQTLILVAHIRKLRDKVAALEGKHLMMRKTVKSTVTRGDQMEARGTSLAVWVAQQKSKRKPRVLSVVHVKALAHKEKWNPNRWIGSVSDSNAWDWADEVWVQVAELEADVGEREEALKAHHLVQNKSKGMGGGQLENTRLVRDYMQSELLEITHMFKQKPEELLFKRLRLWDTGADGTFLSPDKLWKMGSVTMHAMLGQRLRGAHWL